MEAALIEHLQLIARASVAQTLGRRTAPGAEQRPCARAEGRGIRGGVEAAEGTLDMVWAWCGPVRSLAFGYAGGCHITGFEIRRGGCRLRQDAYKLNKYDQAWQSHQRIVLPLPRSFLSDLALPVQTYSGEHDYPSKSP